MCSRVGLLVPIHVLKCFSINREVSSNNMKERCIVATRTICDQHMSIGGMDSIVIISGMKIAASSARKSYHQYIDEEKEKEKRVSLKRKRDENLGHRQSV